MAKGGYREIAAALAGHTGGIVGFTRRLRRDGMPYLSYSKIASVEFCPYRYHLEYIQRVRRVRCVQCKPALNGVHFPAQRFVVNAGPAPNDIRDGKS